MKGQKRQIRIAVLGAGLAGLGAAEGLVQRGERPIVIEKEEKVGGLSRTVNRGGFAFDLGGHRFLPHNKKTADFISDLFNDGALCVRKRRSQIYIRNRYLFYPPELNDILKNLGSLTSFSCLVSGVCHRLKSLLFRGSEASLHDWLINRFGRVLYNIYFGPYSYKLWGKSPSLISSDWAPERISVPNIGSAVKKLLLRDHEGIKTYTAKYLYPPEGIGKIAEKMSKRIAKSGSHVHTGHRVTKVSILKEGFEIEALTSGGKIKVFSVLKIISTIPLNELVSMIIPSPPQVILDSAGNLNFRSIRFMNIMINIPRITENTWIYVPEREIVFFRIQEFSNWHPDNVPPGKTSLTLEIACEKGGDIWRMGDRELFAVCIRDLKNMGIDIEDKVTGYFSTFAEHAYPVYSLSYKDDLQKLYSFFRSMKNILICGRQGLYRYMNMDRAIENGLKAAGSLFDEEKRKGFIELEEEKGYLENNIYIK